MASLNRYLQLQRHIPTGCLVLHPLNIDKNELFNQWRTFADRKDLTFGTSDSAQFQPDAHLPQDIRDTLLAHPTLRPFLHLFKRRWVHYEFRTAYNDGNTGILRVYVLPDDVDRGTTDRSDGKLQKKKQELLAALDFSPITWAGRCSHEDGMTFPSLPQDREFTPTDDDQDMSLLQMFNKIPSPRPDMELVQDDDARECMAKLQAGTVHGLVTDLFAYQTRSAALMLQREAEPGQVLDPRLVQVADQRGEAWYYNPVTGEALREPRRYDGICGGILAEEMGAGKTLICLALILASRHQPTVVPDRLQGDNVTTRPKVGSLMDMAAAVVNKNSYAWKVHLSTDYEHCIAALNRNPGWYNLPRPEARSGSRQPQAQLPPTKIFLSNATLIVVPSNLLQQWTQEISKHTKGLNILVLTNKTEVPPIEELLTYDIILSSIPRLEKLWRGPSYTERDGSTRLESPIAQILFKRCIVDEGHKLGNVRLSGAKTILLRVLDCLQITARWIVTGTPSQGLFGVEEGGSKMLNESSMDQEKMDIERIGTIATSYLKARPWSNEVRDIFNGDTLADWKVYVVQPKHSTRGRGRKDCLRSTFNSLIIRHRLSEVSNMLPEVEHKIVRLEGSYQDKLCLNLFSMMIIFNAVQSQRTDQDYFFHPSNRKALLQLLQNLRQASFFGGSFFSTDEIHKSVVTAEEFLENTNETISQHDAQLLQMAIEFGKTAFCNKVKEAANRFYEMPIYIKEFPGKSGSAWSMDGKDDRELSCTNYRLVLAAQKLLNPWVESTEDLNTYFNSGQFFAQGKAERETAIDEIMPQRTIKDKALSGNTKIGGEDKGSPRKRQSASIKGVQKVDTIPTPPKSREVSAEIAEPLAKTQIVSTCSAKLSYLIDAIAERQKDEQIIIFYENDNTAWYLAGHLDMLQIHYLIYARDITVNRRAQYVSTFNNSTKFRVLLMDISQAAFGLDMRSASRIYFINPVLNPQVEAQAIGRVRRISQKKKVTVETLLLRDSLEEVIVDRKENMTQAEHRKCKSILDDQPIYNWILNAKIIPLPDVDVLDGPNQMAPLAAPQYVFGREFGRERSHPDEDILLDEPAAAKDKDKAVASVELPTTRAGKRKRVGFGGNASDSPASRDGGPYIGGPSRRQATKRARFASGSPSVASSSAASPTPMTSVLNQESICVRFPGEE